MTATSDNGATVYASAYPATDVVFSSTDVSLDQTYVLHSAAAPDSFASSMTVGDDQRMRLNSDRSLSVLDSDGTVAATVPAPFMTDSAATDTDTSTAVSYELSGSAPRYTVTVTPDRDWINDPARVFPIRIDPSVTFQDLNSFGCYYINPTAIGSAGPASDSNSCSQSTGTDTDLVYGQDGHARRIYLKFPDLNNAASPIPADAVVTDASLILTEHSAANSTSLPTQLYRNATGTWSSSTTWGSKPGEDGSLQDSVSFAPPGVNGTSTFKPTAAVRDWVSGAAPNNGLEIRLTDTGEASVTNTMHYYGFANSAHHPQLTVAWQPQVGQQGWIGQYSHKLSDRISLAVDLPNRNLVLTNTDEQLAAPGQALTVKRTYNSRNAAAGISGAFGPGWSLDGGADVTLTVDRQGAVLVGRDGAVSYFRRHFEQSSLTVRQKDNHSDPSYLPSSGLNADLTKPDSTHFKITYRKSHEEWTFTLPSATATVGWLSKIDDGAGNSTTYAASGTPLQTTQITDSTGQRSVSATYTTGRITGLSESLAAGATGARSWSYAYGGSMLATYTDAAGNNSRYCYTSGLLTKIITARGFANGSRCTTTQGDDVTDIAYDSSGAVTSVSYERSGTTPLTLTFATGTALPPGGSSGTTTQTDPYGAVTTYHYDTGDRTTQADSPMGYHRSSKYNTNNDVTASVSPNNFTGGTSDPSNSFSYDPGGLGNLTSSTTPTGTSSSATYNGTDPYKPDTSTDDLGSATNRTYNSNGQVTVATLGNTTVKLIHQGDSGAGNCGPGTGAAYPDALCEARDGLYSSSTPAEHRTLYQYNSLGQLVTKTPAQPDHSRTTPGNWTYTYDSHSRPLTQRDPRGFTLTYTYDAMDHLIKTTDNSGDNYTSNTYDLDGNLTFTGDYVTSTNTLLPGHGHSDTRTYDSLNRQITDAEQGINTITTQWDADSRLVSYDDGVAGAHTYGYNSDGVLTSAAIYGGSCSGYSLTSLPPAASNCILFDVDKNGNRLRTIYPGNKVNEYWAYDTDGKITRTAGTGTAAGSGLTVFDYTFDYTKGTGKTAHISTRHDAVSSSRVEYTYDTRSRLSLAKGYDTLNTGGTNINWRSYCYDAAGNRAGISVTIGTNCSTTQFSYDGANQQLGTDHSYDLDGDETSATTDAPTAASVRTTPSWNDAQSPEQISINGGAVKNQDFIGLDNNGLLSSDTTGGDQDNLAYGPLGISQYGNANSGTVTTFYSYIHDPSGGLLGMRDSNGVEYFGLVDNQASVIAMVKIDGTVADQYYYSPVGTRNIVTNTAPQPLGYLGAYTNVATGLVHLGARFYAPTEYAFTQPDPKSHNSDPTQDSPYAYAGGDPINNSDIDGKNLFDKVTSGVSAGLGLAATVADTFGAPQVGAGLGALSAIVGGVQAAGDCSGIGSGDCSDSIASAAAGTATFGVSYASAKAGSEAASVAADGLGNLNAGYSFGSNF